MGRSTIGRNRRSTGTLQRGGFLYDHVAGPSLDQAGFRGRNDDGSETTATWKAAENTDWAQAEDTNFRVRFVLDETVGSDAASADWKYQYNLNGAGWNDVTASSLVVRASASGVVANGTATTRQLSAGSGSFRAGAVDTNNGAFGVVDLAAGEVTELEACAQVRSADTTPGDTIELRLFNNTTGLPIDAYSQVPTITVGVGDATATPSTVAAVAAVPSPTVLAAAITSPDTVAAVAAVPSPTVSGTAIVSPTTVAAVAAVPAPTVVAESPDATVSPATVAAVASVPSVTVAATAIASPSTVAAVAAVPSPTISGTAIVAPSTVAAVASVPSPTVLAAARPTPSTVAAVAAVPSVTVRGTAIVQPTTVAAVAQVPAPSVLAGGSVTVGVATVAATAAIPAPTAISGAAVVAPNTVAAVAAVPAPTAIRGTAIVTPTTVAARAEVPSPGIPGALVIYISEGDTPLFVGFESKGGGPTDPPLESDSPVLLGITPG